jgi:hypothetical protein
MHPARWFLSAEKSHHRLRQYRASSRLSQKAKKINFQNQCSDSRHPTHGPTKALSAEVMGQSAAGTGVVVDVTMGGPAVIASMSAQEQRANRQSNFRPTCRLVSSPEAGPRATVGTLNQGYPLLQYEDAVPVRRVFSHTVNNARPHHMGRSRGTVWQGKMIYLGCISRAGPPRRSAGPLYAQPGPPIVARDS